MSDLRFSMKKQSRKKFSWVVLVSPSNGRNPIFAFTVLGILTIWIFNVPIYLFRLVQSQLQGSESPPERTLFYVPQFLDTKFILPALGIVSAIFVYCIGCCIR